MPEQEKLRILFRMLITITREEEEKRLEEVMSILSRWYDFEIFYQNAAVKDLHFTGNIPRHATINEVLKFLERTHLVHFSVVGRTVIVSE